MNPEPARVPTGRNLVRLALPLGFFTLYALYVWKRIDPSLTYQDQEPVFFFGAAFLRESLGRPGGLALYASAFLSQFFLFPWAGALIVTAVAWLTSRSVRWMIRRWNDSRNVEVLHLVPAVLLLMLHSNARHPLSASLGFLASLVFYNLYLRFAPGRAAARVAFFAFSTAALHLAAGGPFLLYPVLCLLTEAADGRGRPAARMAVGLSFLLIAAALPLAFREALFMTTVKAAFTGLLPLVPNTRPAWAPAALYAFPPLLLLAERLARTRAARAPRGRNRAPRRPGAAAFLRGRSGRAAAVRAAGIFAVAAAGALVSYDPVNHALLRVDSLARRRMWPEVLRAARGGASEYALVAFHINRALAHLGLLPDRMFSYPQRLGVEGLFFPAEFRYLVPLQCSDLHFDLGNVNEAQHWAHEAVSQRGETPWALERLVQTHTVRGEKEAAALCLAKLKRTVFHRKWAERFERGLGADSLALGDAALARLRAVMPDSDFVVNSEEPHLNLDAMLSEARPNRMAFEYLMASCLLQGKIGRFVNRLRWLRTFRVTRLPVHYEEALLLYLAEKGRPKFELEGVTVSAETVRRFRDYFAVLERYGGNRAAAMAELKRLHGNTYWFYGTYTLAALKSRPPVYKRGRR